MAKAEEDIELMRKHLAKYNMLNEEDILDIVKGKQTKANFDTSNVNVSSDENKDMNIQDEIATLEAEIAAATCSSASAAD